MVVDAFRRGADWGAGALVAAVPGGGCAWALSRVVAMLVWACVMAVIWWRVSPFCVVLGVAVVVLAGDGLAVVLPLAPWF